MSNSFASSHGRLRVLKTTSASSDTVKASSSSAHRTIRARSRTSSAGHLRCRAARLAIRGFGRGASPAAAGAATLLHVADELQELERVDRKSTRLNSSHVKISYAVFCLKKKNT